MVFKGALTEELSRDLSPALAYTQLHTSYLERMDAAYKRVNGNYSPEAETGDQVPGVNLTYS